MTNKTQMERENKLIFKMELWDYINDVFGHEKATYHTNKIMKSVNKLLEKALSQKEDEVRKEVEKLKKFNLPISESGRVPIKYRYWNKGYNQAIEDVLQSLTK